MEPLKFDQQPPGDGGLPPEGVTHVPLWVKGLAIVGLILFAAQLPAFPKSLEDSITKHQASNYFNSGDYRQAAEGYEELHASYPDNTTFTKNLAFSYYRSDAYSEALVVFDELSDELFLEAEANEINGAITDIIDKLGLKAE